MVSPVKIQRITGDTMNGTVRTYFSEKGYGFLAEDTADGTLKSHFFHINHCRVEPKAGMRVQFELAAGPKGLMAVDLRPIPPTVEEIVAGNAAVIELAKQKDVHLLVKVPTAKDGGK
jgi:CspA family cold shock protein